MNANVLIVWLEAHDKLAGWAQFFGAVIALIVTYFTAFAPIWIRKRQLNKSAQRLIEHGYEVLESYHRTSAYFVAHPINLKMATLSMKIVVDEMNRFPSSELERQDSNSLARRLVAMSGIVGGCSMLMEWTLERLGEEAMTQESHDELRDWIGQQLRHAGALVLGKPMTRPEWPGGAATSD
jgi:H+/gluconate symporter-like permease